MIESSGVDFEESGVDGAVLDELKEVSCHQAAYPFPLQAKHVYPSCIFHVLWLPEVIPFSLLVGRIPMFMSCILSIAAIFRVGAYLPPWPTKAGTRLRWRSSGFLGWVGDKRFLGILLYRLRVFPATEIMLGQPGSAAWCRRHDNSSAEPFHFGLGSAAAFRHHVRDSF